MTSPVHSVTVIRTFPAPLEAVYGAWTEPSMMKRWMASFVDADVRVGGRYRIENHERDGTVNAFVGEYRVLDPGRRIVQSFRHTETEPETFFDEFLELNFKRVNSTTTELTLLNAWTGQGMSDVHREAMQQAWSQWLDLLHAALRRPAAEAPTVAG
ncbi:MAG: SRPBCC domain-containing protein [Deltaproteobacteria bacterium]|nr:SRPBCC domain-containing protein [Deltaproteobacteria bacterium]